MPENNNDNAGSQATDQGQDDILKDEKVQQELKKREEKIKKELEDKHKLELEEAKKHAGQTEKQKLYETLEKERKEKKEFEEQLKKYKDEEEAKKAKAKQEEFEKKPVEDKISMLTKKLEERDALTEKERERMEKLLEKQQKLFQDEIEKEKLETYKEKIINKYEGKIIPELVFGNTKEEIDNAAKKANERFMDILKASEKAGKEDILNNGGIPAPDGNKNIQQKGNQNKSPRYRDIIAMSETDFDKYSDDYLKNFIKKKT